MLQAQRHPVPHSAANVLLCPSLSPFPYPRSLNFPLRPANQHCYPLCSAHTTWIAQIAEELAGTAATVSGSALPVPDEGPVEIPSSIAPLFATTDDPTLLQTATSVLLTGAITVFLFRSLRRRAKRAKETKFRSSGAKKSLKEEAVESLKSVSLSPVTTKSPPSPVQAFLGAVTAGVIALILYKFATTVEASLNRQTISDNYSVRQITITIRTIINGICYLATFVFGINAFGLFLYSGQLALNSFMEDSNSEKNTPLSSSNSKTDSSDISATTKTSEDQSSDNTQ